MSYSNPFSLEGKTVLITGASSGIGRTTAVECSKMGATVILTARNQERLLETLSMMVGGGHSIILADMANEDDICDMVKKTPKLNGVVCAAGLTCLKPLKYYSKSAVENTFSINTFASMYLIRELLRENKIAPEASLVFISSIESTLVYSMANGIYSASKAALDAFSKQCALELANLCIRSNSVQPGPVKTDLLFRSPLFSEDDIESMNHFQDETCESTLLKRLGRPEEIAWAVVFLLSEAASFITGSTIVIDGGYHVKL